MFLLFLICRTFKFKCKMHKLIKNALTVLLFEEILTPVPLQMYMHMNMLYHYINFNLQLNNSLLSCFLRYTHFRIPNFYERWVTNYIEYDFYTHFRMTRDTYNKLLCEIGVLYNENYKKHYGGLPMVDAGKSLLITIWYLGKGESMISIADRFNVSISTVFNVLGKIIHCICLLKDKYIQWPFRDDEKISLSQQFKEIAGYPGVIGAIDCTHITCKIPEIHHDSYQDRKFNHSIILQGVCTANKFFSNVCIGFPGSVHDARVLRESALGRAVEEYSPRYFFDGNYHLIGDSAYPCRTWIIVPYRDNGRLSRKQRKHNCILSSTRVVIENLFGLLKNRWRILHYVNVNSIKRAVDIITASAVLHNFCLISGDAYHLFDNQQSVELDAISNVEITTEMDDESGIEKRNEICNTLYENQ